MRIINYFESVNREQLTQKIAVCDWSAARFLAELLEKGTFHDTLGGWGDLYLLMDGENLVSFLTFTGQDETAVLRGAVKFRDSLNTCLRTPDYQLEKCTVLGPAPCPVPKINYNFRYRLTLRCVFSKQLRNLVASLLRQFSQDKLNRGVSAFADVNGFD